VASVQRAIYPPGSSSGNGSLREMEGGCSFTSLRVDHPAQREARQGDAGKCGENHFGVFRLSKVRMKFSGSIARTRLKMSIALRVVRTLPRWKRSNSVRSL
jgi:hypothetical protein